MVPSPSVNSSVRLTDATLLPGEIDFTSAALTDGEVSFKKQASKSRCRVSRHCHSRPTSGWRFSARSSLA